MSSSRWRAGHRPVQSTKTLVLRTWEPDASAVVPTGIEPVTFRV
jgi:hypothetical protein